MDNFLTERIFEEIDMNGKRIEDLSKLVYTQATTLGIVTKLVMGIISFLVLAGLAAVIDIPAKIHKSEPQQISQQHSSNLIPSNPVTKIEKKEGK